MPVLLHRPYRSESETCHVPNNALYAFIAGPIMGARDFQTEAGKELARAIPSDQFLHIADPRWTNIPQAAGLAPNKQRAWEIAHYQKAWKLGSRSVMLFYLAAETEDAPVPNKPGRAYGQGTRSEFSETIGYMQGSWQSVQVVIGIDPQHNRRGIGEYLDRAPGFNIPIYEGLQPTCQAAAELLMRGAHQ